MFTGRNCNLEVVKDLPADKAGIKTNDVVLAIDGQEFSAVPDIQAYVKAHAGTPVEFSLLRQKENIKVSVVPNANPPQGEGPTGVALSLVGKLKYPVHVAVWEGGNHNFRPENIVSGLYGLIISRTGFANLGGPVKYQTNRRGCGYGVYLSLAVYGFLS